MLVGFGFKTLETHGSFWVITGRPSTVQVRTGTVAEGAQVMKVVSSNWRHRKVIEYDRVEVYLALKPWERYIWHGSVELEVGG